MSDDLADLVRGNESGVAAILREGVERHKSSVRDDDIPMTQEDLGAAVELAETVESTAADDSPGHASALNETLRQAERDGDMLESTEDYSMLRTTVDSERLTAENELDYLVLLALEGKRYATTKGDDDIRAAKWAISQWCQEIGWAPDLAPFDASEQVPYSTDVDSCDAVFYEYARADRDGQEDADE